MLHYQYSYAALLVQGCCTFGARGLHFYWHYYSKVFTVAFLAVFELRFFCNTILNSIIGFPSGRRTLFLHSSFFILIAALRSVSLRLQSLNQKTLTEYRIFSESFHGFVFWFFLFDFLLTWIVPWQDKWDFRRIFLLIVPWQDKGILDGFVYWFCLYIKWFVWGRLVFNLIYANVFFRTLIERIWRILQVCGTCFIKGKILVHWQDKRDFRRIRLLILSAY